MTERDEHYAFRAAMVEALRTDLLGPSSVEEIIDESPLDRYLIGILHPVQEVLLEEVAEEPESAKSANGDTAFDPGVALAHMRFPSSFGMSLAVDTDRAREIEFTVRLARYESITDESMHEKGDLRSRARKRRQAGGWRRVAVEPDPIRIGIGSPEAKQIDLAAGLGLFVMIRPTSDGIVPVTVILRNTHKAGATSRAEDCWFQPEITATTEMPAFVSRVAPRSHSIGDDDLDSYDLLFRDARRFAAGHGCAVDWERGPGEFREEIRTSLIPDYEVRLSTPRAAGAGTDLRMSTLAKASNTSGLRAMVDQYRAWIRERRDDASLLPHVLRAAAERHLALAEQAAVRIERGIKKIESDDDVARAFSLMNQAMMQQRARQDWIRSDGTQPLGDGAEQAWRPFQIAFILLNLEGLADPESDDREKADLLWFPTGGGKTEAYLGLIALSILIRRLRNPKSRGVTAMMRYTLRLLTLQQFERASTLICALERIRLTDSRLSAGERISIGLWVGQQATPNSLADAQTALRDLKQKKDPSKGNPVQLTRCPWCGQALTVDNYKIVSHPDRLIVACGSSACDFGSELPVMMVDEDVYRERPTLLIGTVDKFAMMAWNENVQSIFSSDGRGDRPDLIVQDELHLIAGPLGTMVGLYETAVDAAATGVARPKLVASTATIRRAQEQIKAVFARESFQFPPPGLDPADSFFAVESTPDQMGTRQYIGLLAPGVSAATLMIRTYGALLDAASRIEGSDAVRDPYWTLVGYFNSLRVLGGAYMQVMDDVVDRLAVLAGRHGCEPRRIGIPAELTSRVTSAEIPIRLANLARTYPDPASPSVMLATNMISVGVDVDRLGLMAVMGQPQSTAEYIQSTSRVGRKYPGLVITMYNSARSRDRSHFESFLPYHQSLYREVEATSATPFASRARDRGLHGVLVSMARLLIPEAAGNDDAVNIESFRLKLLDICDLIAQRAEEVDPREAQQTRDELDLLVSLWERAAYSMGRLKYKDYQGQLGGAGESLLIDAGAALATPDSNLEALDGPWPTLTSLRDVDAESVLSLVRSHNRRSS